MHCVPRLPDLGLLNAGSGRLPDMLLGLGPPVPSSRPPAPDPVSEAPLSAAGPPMAAAPVLARPPPPQYSAIVETGRGIEERRFKPDPMPPVLAASSPRLAPVIEVTRQVRDAHAAPAGAEAARACCSSPSY